MITPKEWLQIMDEAGVIPVPPTEELPKPNAELGLMGEERLYFTRGGTVTADSVRCRLIVVKDGMYGVNCFQASKPRTTRVHVNSVVQYGIYDRMYNRADNEFYGYPEYYFEGNICWIRKLTIGSHYTVRAQKETFDERLRRVWK